MTDLIGDVPTGRARRREGVQVRERRRQRGSAGVVRQRRHRQVPEVEVERRHFADGGSLEVVFGEDAARLVHRVEQPAGDGSAVEGLGAFFREHPQRPGELGVPEPILLTVGTKGRPSPRV